MVCELYRTILFGYETLRRKENREINLWGFAKDFPDNY